jgi:hypothetical protein
MTNSGTATFTNPEEYQAGFGGTSVKLVLTGRGDFKARLTWVKLRHINLLRAHENLARIAFVSLPPTRAFISFALGSNGHPMWNGVKLRSRDIVFHSHRRATPLSDQRREPVGAHFDSTQAAGRLQPCSDGY